MIARRRERTERDFRLGQLASASLVALSHGTNDAQKTMGVITLAMIANGMLERGAGDVERDSDPPRVPGRLPPVHDARDIGRGQGAGVGRRAAEVHWGIAGQMELAWLYFQTQRSGAVRAGDV